MSFPFRRTPTEFKRQPQGRKKEAGRARKENITSIDYQNIKNKLGLNQRTSEEKTKHILTRFRWKSKRTWDAIGITEADFKKFGISLDR